LRCEHPVGKVNMPGCLLAWVIRVLLQPPVMNHHGQLVRLLLREDLWSRTQVGPPLLDFHQCLSVTALGLDGVAGAETALLLALTDKRAQVVWDAFTEPIDTAAGMFPWT
jgi:hypothetical protein